MVFNAIFILEYLIKSISLGFALDHKSYLRDNWSQLDFLIVIFSIIDMSIQSDLSFMKVIRLLRILRPLRFISHNPSMKLIVNSLI